MKRKDVTPDVWLAHRKERKKIASAKWYAAKKRAEIREQHQKRRELEAQLQAEKKTYIWSDEERASWRCVLDNIHRQWPCRPAHISALVWCELMDLTQECVDRMHIDWSTRPRQLEAARHLCMRELRQCYEAGAGLDSIRARIRSRSSPVAHQSVDSTASHSSWENIAAKLTGGWFPFVCTGVGLLFLQLAVLGQVRHWPGLVHHMYSVQQTTTASDQQNGDSPPHTSPPHQNPMHNPVLNDPDIQLIVAALIRQQQEQQYRETCMTDEEDDSTLSEHSSYFSCSQPSSLDTLCF